MKVKSDVSVTENDNGFIYLGFRIAYFLLPNSNKYKNKSKECLNGK